MSDELAKIVNDFLNKKNFITLPGLNGEFPTCRLRCFEPRLDCISRIEDTHQKLFARANKHWNNIIIPMLEEIGPNRLVWAWDKKHSIHRIYEVSIEKKIETNLCVISRLNNFVELKIKAESALYRGNSTNL